LKIGFVTPSVSRIAGGIFEIERRLAQCLTALPETDVRVYGMRDNDTDADLATWRPLVPKTFPTCGPRGFGYAPRMLSEFMREDVDVAHLHALWMFSSVVVHRWAKAVRRPYLVTLNGMLDSWAVRNSAWKKRLALALYERACLRDAACIQVNSLAELQTARAFGLTNAICVVPNGIDLPETLDGAQPESENPMPSLVKQGRKVLLYLGRLHPKKGLTNLIKGWRHALHSRPAASSSWMLAIAGWDQGEHEKELQILSAECGTQNSVLFLGPKFGAEKAACYRNCEAFVLPSLSEGLPMAILEAWSYAKPVLMTPECNLPEAFAAGAALPIRSEPESIKKGLHSLFDMSPTGHEKMGRRGLQLVLERFTWDTIAKDMRSIYAWLAQGGSPPACVVK
jgi:glycosyltransferase involved in cell wall biosynthesis